MNVTFLCYAQDLKTAGKNTFPIVGTSAGLFRTTGKDLEPLWTESAVHKIVKTDAFYLLTDKGIFRSEDLLSFMPKNEGLPFLTIKDFDGKPPSYSSTIQMLKDLEVHPENKDIMVTAVRNMVYLSRDAGATWKSLGFSAKTSGLKAVAVASMPSERSPDGELTVFMSHSIYGISYIQPDTAKPRWIDITAGFTILPTLTSPDEISDIVPVVRILPDGKKEVRVYFGQSFVPRLTVLDWEAKRGRVIWDGGLTNATVDSIIPVINNDGASVYFTGLGGFSLFDEKTGQIIKNPAASVLWNKYLESQISQPECAYFFKGMSGLNQDVSLSELWLLRPQAVRSKYSDVIADRKGLYLPIYQATTGGLLDKHIDTAIKNGLNTIILDMKDDYGLLRYDTQNPVVKEKCFVSEHSIKLEDFVAKTKAKNLYLVARIVVFKDKHLAGIENNKYAVWDSKNSRQWLGIRGYTDIVDEQNVVTGKKPFYYDEHWVDPYSEKVWEYNTAIARELIERGFDEIQFDYIRFPTDGLNLGDASYRWKDKSMDMECALISFLSYARKNIHAPIGIDIYGANGWYRSGARTGQDVELLAQYVDLIHPMFYPNHFEQPFLAYQPEIERPYRVYYFGTYRNTVIARGHVLVRPWVQAFYLPVSFDRKYYNKDFVRREIFGVRDSLNNGYMYWNNSGRYDDIVPDIADNEPYFGAEPYIPPSSTVK